jgi:hypothetical protein
MTDELVKFNFNDITTFINDTGLPLGWQNIKKSNLINNNNNTGLLTGEINNITVVDYDSKDKFLEDDKIFNFRTKIITLLKLTRVFMFILNIKKN